VHQKIEEDIEELVEIARQMNDPALLSELAHLRAIAIQETSLRNVISGHNALQFRQPVDVIKPDVLSYSNSAQKELASQTVEITLSHIHARRDIEK